MKREEKEKKFCSFQFLRQRKTDIERENQKEMDRLIDRWDRDEGPMQEKRKKRKRTRILRYCPGWKASFSFFQLSLSLSLTNNGEKKRQKEGES